MTNGRPQVKVEQLLGACSDPCPRCGEMARVMLRLGRPVINPLATGPTQGRLKIEKIFIRCLNCNHREVYDGDPPVLVEAEEWSPNTSETGSPE